MHERWVLASPSRDTYAGRTEGEIAEAYRKMAFVDFDKQFKKKKGESVIEDTINAMVRGKVQPLNRTEIEVGIAEWNGTYVDAMLHCFIYTTMKGIPIGEADFVRKADGKADIAENLKKFYEKYKWRAWCGEMKVDPSSKQIDDDLLCEL